MYRIFLTALAIRKRIFTASTASAFCLQRCDQRAHANDERWRGVGRGRLAKDLFRQLAIVTVSRIAWAIGLSIAAGVILAGPARAQIVSNGSFEVPNVASAPNGVIENSNAALSGPGVAWKFPSVSGGDSGITLEQQASGFDAPKAPNGDQVGLIHNLGENKPRNEFKFPPRPWHWRLRDWRSLLPVRRCRVRRGGPWRRAPPFPKRPACRTSRRDNPTQRS
jgi:hypothetical protein